MRKGLIVSIQQFSFDCTYELSRIAKQNGAVAVRTDKIMNIGIPTIILKKAIVKDKYSEPYITIDEKFIKAISGHSEYVAIDCRTCNKKMKQLTSKAKKNRLKVIADIRNIKDYENIIIQKIEYDYIATTFSVFDRKANYRLIKQITEINNKEKIIAEGGYSKIDDIEKAFLYGASNVCIGHAITGIKKKIKNYVEVINDFCN